MTATVDHNSTHDTRVRLLDAAGKVFAEHGFEQATIRDICAIAAANVASVKYHFGGKTELYRATMRHFRATAEERIPESAPPDAEPAERLRAYIRRAIYLILDQGPESVHGRLMAWEMTKPTPALDDHVEEVVRPMAGELREIVLALSPGLDEQAARAMMGSIIGQVLFYKHSRPVLEKLFPGQPTDAEAFERLAEHITSFSLRGLGVEG
ncbi:MAG: CerR family C-terminal domain-containing protein [Planctomycetota bacterium]